MARTPEQKAEIVSHNIALAKAIIYEAERINKGRYTHAINVDMNYIKSLLKKKSTLKYSSDDFKRLCLHKQALAANLYLVEKGL